MIDDTNEAQKKLQGLLAMAKTMQNTPGNTNKQLQFLAMMAKPALDDFIKDGGMMTVAMAAMIAKSALEELADDNDEITRLGKAATAVSLAQVFQVVAQIPQKMIADFEKGGKAEMLQRASLAKDPEEKKLMLALEQAAVAVVPTRFAAFTKMLENTAGDSASTADRYDRAMAAISKLPIEQVEDIYKKHFEELPVADTAKSVHDALQKIRPESIYVFLNMVSESLDNVTLSELFESAVNCSKQLVDAAAKGDVTKVQDPAAVRDFGAKLKSALQVVEDALDDGDLLPDAVALAPIFRALMMPVEKLEAAAAMAPKPQNPAP